jgi:hypothetical protein
VPDQKHANTNLLNHLCQIEAVHMYITVLGFCSHTCNGGGGRKADKSGREEQQGRAAGKSGGDERQGGAVDFWNVRWGNEDKCYRPSILSKKIQIWPPII